MAKLTVKGLDKLEKQLKENVKMDDVKRVVRHNGEQMQQKIQNNADFTRGYATGQTKKSIGLEFTDSGFTVSSGATTEYAPYLEYGTRFMSAQKFISPGYNEQKEKFKRDMQKLTR